MSRAASIGLAAGAVALFGAAAGITQANRVIADVVAKIQQVSVVNPSVPVNAADSSAATLRADPAVANVFGGSIVGGKTAMVVQDANNAQHPFMEEATITMASGVESGTTFTSNVPAGKRAVIESVSVFAQIPTGEQIFQSDWSVFSINFANNQVALARPIFPTFNTSIPNFDFYSATETVRAYAEANTPLVATAQRIQTTGQATFNFIFVGYLVDAP
jgi:hypothetical protein